MLTNSFHPFYIPSIKVIYFLLIVYKLDSNCIHTASHCGVYSHFICSNTSFGILVVMNRSCCRPFFVSALGCVMNRRSL